MGLPSDCLPPSRRPPQMARTGNRPAERRITCQMKCGKLRSNFSAESLAGKTAPVDQLLIYSINVPYPFHFAVTIFMSRVTVLTIRPKVSTKPTLWVRRSPKTILYLYTTNSYATFLFCKTIRQRRNSHSELAVYEPSTALDCPRSPRICVERHAASSHVDHVAAPGRTARGTGRPAKRAAHDDIRDAHHERTADGRPETCNVKTVHQVRGKKKQQCVDHDDPETHRHQDERKREKDEQRLEDAVEKAQQDRNDHERPPVVASDARHELGRKGNSERQHEPANEQLSERR